MLPVITVSIQLEEGPQEVQLPKDSCPLDITASPQEPGTYLLTSLDTGRPLWPHLIYLSRSPRTDLGSFQWIGVSLITHSPHDIQTWHLYFAQRRHTLD